MGHRIMASTTLSQPARSGPRLPLNATRRVLAAVAITRTAAAVLTATAVAIFGPRDAQTLLLTAVLIGIVTPWQLHLLREALVYARWPWLAGPADAVITAGVFLLAPASAWPALIVLGLVSIAVEASRGGLASAWVTGGVVIGSTSIVALALEPRSAGLSLGALATGSIAIILAVGLSSDEQQVSLRRLGSALDGAAGIVWEADAHENRLAFVSGRIRHLLGYGPWEIAHRRLRWIDVVHPDDHHTVIDLERISELEFPHVREFRMRTRDGDWIWLRDTVRCERRPDGTWALRGTATDITAERTETLRAEALSARVQQMDESRKRDRADKRRDALHDPLTGLPNRSHLIEHLRMLLQRDASAGANVALMVLDLDQFKEVNDTLGHHYGDEMLREVAARLADQRRGDDLLARLGGDEFAILLSPNGSERAEDVAANIVKSIRKPLTLRGLQVQAAASIGIARFPDDSTEAGELLQKAEVAMYAAKSTRRGWTWYSPDNDRFSVRRLRLLGELPRALSKAELVVFYQPKIDLQIGTVVGVEALVRWNHPELGMIMPDEFIELTEVSGLVTELTRTVLTRTIAQLAEWDSIGVKLDAAVNLSVRDFQDDELVPFIVETLRRHDIVPTRLMLEITESQVVDDLERATEVLLELSSLGIGTSIDDFGTGFSSLSHLRQLPVAEIKIDRSFVGQMATNQNDAVIVRSIVELGHNLDLEVVAEGVEDEWTLDALRSLGCDRAQGYFFRRPVPGSEIPEFVGELAAANR